MSISTPIVVTDAEWLRAADEGGVEFVDGELREKNVSREAKRVSAQIIRVLATEAKDRRGGDVYVEQGYRCFADEPRRFRKPDVSFVRAERLPPAGVDVDLLSLPPDLAVEVVSPNDLFYEVESKVREYLDAGFGTIWVVNAETKSVRVHRLDGSVEQFDADDEITGEPFLPGFRCKVGAFFE